MPRLSGDYRVRHGTAPPTGIDLVLDYGRRAGEIDAAADAAPDLAGKSGERAAPAAPVNSVARIPTYCALAPTSAAVGGGAR